MTLNQQIQVSAFYGGRVQRVEIPIEQESDVLIVVNASAFDIRIIFTDYAEVVPANVTWKIKLCHDRFFEWDILEIAGSTSASTDYLYFSVATTARAALYTPIAMTRAVNVGNEVGVTMPETERIVNYTHAAGDRIVEAGPVDSAGVAQVWIDNLGTAQFGYTFSVSNAETIELDAWAIGLAEKGGTIRGLERHGGIAFPFHNANYNGYLWYRQDLQRWYLLDTTASAGNWVARWIAVDPYVLPFTQDFTNPYTASAAASWRCRLPFGGNANARFFGTFDLLVAQTVASTASNYHTVAIFQRWEGTLYPDVQLATYTTLGLGANVWSRIGLSVLSLPTWKAGGEQTWLEMRVSKSVAHASSLFVQPQFVGREGFIVS